MTIARSGILLLFCLTVACVPDESPSRATVPSPDVAPPAISPSPREIAVGIDASKSELRSELRNGSAGAIDVREVRYYVGDTLVLIEETFGVPDDGGSVTAYYFDDDRLVFFRGRGMRTFFIPGRGETRENYDIELGYDQEGNVVDSRKTIDGVPAALEPLDYEAPRIRATRLLGG